MRQEDSWLVGCAEYIYISITLNVNDSLPPALGLSVITTIQVELGQAADRAARQTQKITGTLTLNKLYQDPTLQCQQFRIFCNGVARYWKYYYRFIDCTDTNAILI